MKIVRENYDDLSAFKIKFNDEKWFLEDEPIPPQTHRNEIFNFVNSITQAKRSYFITTPYTPKNFKMSERDSHILILKSGKTKRTYEIELTQYTENIYSVIQIFNRLIILFNNDTFDVYVPYKQLIYEESLNHQGIMKDVFEIMLRKPQVSKYVNFGKESINVMLDSGIVKIKKKTFEFLHSEYMNDILSNMKPDEIIGEFKDFSESEFDLLCSPFWRNSDEKSLNILHKLNSIYFYVRCKELYNRMFPFVSTLNFSKLLKFFL